MRSHHWVSLALCFWKTYSMIHFHTLLLQSPSRLPPVEQRANCLVNEVLDGLWLSVIAQIRPDTTVALGPGTGCGQNDQHQTQSEAHLVQDRVSSMCPALGDSCALCVLSGINWLQRWAELETDTRHVCDAAHFWYEGNEAWQHHT